MAEYGNRCADEVLWQKTMEGDPLAENELITRYAKLVRICARPYFLAGGDSEDLIQEGMLGLISAIRQYDPKNNTTFRVFAEICIRRRIFTAIKAASRFKHTPLNDYVSLESSQFDGNKTLASNFLRDPEELVIAGERVDEITEKLKGLLSSFESTVLKYYLQGLSYDDIATCVNKTAKSVDNAVQRIRGKLARYLTNGDFS